MSSPEYEEEEGHHERTESLASLLSEILSGSSSGVESEDFEEGARAFTLRGLSLFKGK